MDIKYYRALFIYLIIFPIAGCIIGYVFYFIYELIGNYPSEFHFKIFVFVWFFFGLIAGVYGIFILNKMRKLNSKNK